MGVFSGRVAEQRSVFPYPDIPPNSAAGVAPSFLNVGVSNTESAMRRIAVFASVNLIAGLSSSLPVDGYTGRGTSRREISLPPFFTDPDGSGQGFGDWVYQLLYSWLLRGNAVGEILDTDSLGRPAMIALAHPDSVSVHTGTDGRSVWHFGGREVPNARVWHRRMYPVPGKQLGMSPIGLHATSIGLGLAAESFGLRWFLDGGHPSAILQQEDTATVTQDEAVRVKQRFLNAVRGNREPVVMGKGWKYQAIQIAPNESQFLDTQKYTAAECARIFGPGIPEVLGYETGGTMTYTNVEQRSLDLLKFNLDRYFVRTESVLSTDILPAPRYIKFNRGALLATDLTTRYRAHEIALRNQFSFVNEVRALEDNPPVPWGNEPTAAAVPATKTPEPT